MPVYNERTTIEEIILRVQDVDLDKEIVIVDDASTDDTPQVLAAAGVRATRMPAQGGPGAARNAGWRAGLGELVVFITPSVLRDPTRSTAPSIPPAR